MKKNKKIRNAIIFIAALAYVAFSIFIAATHTKNSLYNERLPNLPTKSVVNTAWNCGMVLEVCNGVYVANDPAATYNVLNSAAQQYVLTGWAVDMDNGRALSDLYVVLNGKVLKAEYGFERPDVGDALANHTLDKCGFTVTLPGLLLKDDMFELAGQLDFYMVSADGTYMYQPITYKNLLRWFNNGDSAEN